MSDGPLSFQRSWEGFLPPNTIIMAKRGAVAESRPRSDLQLQPILQPPFGFEASDAGEPAARALLEKILSALELQAGDYMIYPRAPEDFNGRVLVRFAAEEKDAGAAGVWDKTRMTTYSLQAMLGSPGLKKSVWAHLKEAIARGRSSEREGG